MKEEIFENVDTISCDKDEDGYIECSIGTLMDMKEILSIRHADDVILDIDGWIVFGSNFDVRSPSISRRCEVRNIATPIETDLGTDYDVTTKIECR